jgi:hypothetical protein
MHCAWCASLDLSVWGAAAGAGSHTRPTFAYRFVELVCCRWPTARGPHGAETRVLLVAQLRAAGVRIDGQETEEAAGRFAWLVDPEGNRVELWEPTPDVLEPADRRR